MVTKLSNYHILSSIKNLKALNKIDIDLNDLSIVDAGSPDNYLAMTKLMLSEGRDIVALLDGDKSGDDSEKRLNKTCEKEIKDKKLQIHKLPKDQSIEDVFPDLTCFQESTKATIQYLIDNGFRKLKDTILVDTEVSKIKPSKGKTLGKVSDEITTQMFTEEEKLSKLSISLDYEDRIVSSKSLPSTEATKEIETLKNLLNLRGEKSAEVGVFDVVAKSR